MDYEIFDLDLDELAEAMMDNIKEDTKSFIDLINLEGSISREIYISEITNGTGTTIDAFIRFWNHWDTYHNVPKEERQPIKIYIDSCGGSLTDTFTVIDAIKMSKTPVWTICTGCAYSGGFFIMVSGHRRIAYSRASFLFHEGSTGNTGTAGQFDNYAAFYRKQLEILKQIVIENTNITEEDYKDIKKDDIWYSAEEALEKGIIDEIAGELI